VSERSKRLRIQFRRAAASGTESGIESTTTDMPPYVPSPMDYSLLVPQLVGLAALGICMAYWQLVLSPTAQVKYNLQDENKKKYVKDLMADDSRALERILYKAWLKPLPRPRGDQTKEGTVIPGVQDATRNKVSRGNVATAATAVATPPILKDTPQSTRTFQFVEYGEDYQSDGKVKSICCDGLVRGSDLQLTHWTNNETPAEYYADTSTEIALNFLESSAATTPEWAEAVVLNNHFDTDGILSVWALLHPQEALPHRELLIAGAAAGDFEEWVGDGRGVKLDLALTKMVSQLSHSYGGDEDARAYKQLLPKVGSLLKDLDNRQDLWGDAWLEYEEAEARVTKGEVQAERIGDVGLVIHPLDDAHPIPGCVASKLFGGGFGGVKRLLYATEVAGHDNTTQYKYTYSMAGHGWVRTVDRPNLEAPDKEKLAAAMGQDWVVKQGLNGIVHNTRAVALEPRDMVVLLSELSETKTL